MGQDRASINAFSASADTAGEYTKPWNCSQPTACTWASWSCVGDHRQVQHMRQVHHRTDDGVVAAFDE